MGNDNAARDYALLIKEEIIGLDILLETWADLEDVSEEDALESMVSGDYENVKNALVALELSWGGYDGADIVGDYLNGACLSLDIWRNDNGTDGPRIEILRTCGGPRCDILRDTDDSSFIEIVVNSGSDSCRLRFHAESVAAYLDEMAGV